MTACLVWVVEYSAKKTMSLGMELVLLKLMGVTPL